MDQLFQIDFKTKNRTTQYSRPNFNAFVITNTVQYKTILYYTIQSFQNFNHKYHFCYNLWFTDKTSNSRTDFPKLFLFC